MANKTSNNDKIILNLKKQIEEKKQALKLSEKFVPVTNCSLVLHHDRYNLHVIGEEEIVILLVVLNSYKKSAEELGLVKDFVLSGFPVGEWIQDLQTRLMIVNRKTEEAKLKALETRLHNLLSVETKVELEIEEISKMI